MITSFTKNHRFLSNFYYHPMIYKQQLYTTAEHLFQSFKFIHNPHHQDMIREAKTPSQAKSLGRSLTGIREDWEYVKIYILMSCLKLKFSDPTLRSLLESTKDNELIEGNTWCDNFYGVCFCNKCRGDIGLNKLGKLLMAERDNTLFDI